jgi:hypothetical protein
MKDSCTSEFCDDFFYELGKYGTFEEFNMVLTLTTKYTISPEDVKMLMKGVLESNNEPYFENFSKLFSSAEIIGDFDCVATFEMKLD